MLNEGHHTLKGIQRIVNIRASLNTGLSDELKEAFPSPPSGGPPPVVLVQPPHFRGNWKVVSTKDLESSTKNNISYSNIHSD